MLFITIWTACSYSMLSTVYSGVLIFEISPSLFNCLHADKVSLNFWFKIVTTEKIIWDMIRHNIKGKVVEYYENSMTIRVLPVFNLH